MYSDIKPVQSPHGLVSYKTVTDIEAVRNSLINLFTVQKNEVPGKPWFGNPLRLSVFDLFDAFTSKTLENAIVSEVRKYEPRIDIQKVNVVLSPEDNRIVVSITYTVNLEDKMINETMYLPFAHNSYSFLGARNIIIIPETSGNI